MSEPVKPKTAHLKTTDPSQWVVRFAPLIKEGGFVLDLACGGGRHGRYLLSRGHDVVFADQNEDPLLDLKDQEKAECVICDLENGSPWPFDGRCFDAIIVTNYLYRPLFPKMLESLAPGGVLIYETFARGNEDYSRPRNPDHLLKSGELLELARGVFQVVAYEHGIKREQPLPGVVQRICAVKDLAHSQREDGEPPVHPF